MKIKPLNDKVILKIIEAVSSSSYIHIPQTSDSTKSNYGEVVSVGEGKILENGNIKTLKVKIGDKVYFSKYVGTEIDIKGKSYICVSESDILAILEV